MDPILLTRDYLKERIVSILKEESERTSPPKPSTTSEPFQGGNKNNHKDQRPRRKQTLKDPASFSPTFSPVFGTTLYPDSLSSSLSSSSSSLAASAVCGGTAPVRVRRRTRKLENARANTKEKQLKSEREPIPFVLSRSPPREDPFPPPPFRLPPPRVPLGPISPTVIQVQENVKGKTNMKPKLESSFSESGSGESRSSIWPAVKRQIKIKSESNDLGRATVSKPTSPTPQATQSKRHRRGWQGIWQDKKAKIYQCAKPPKIESF